jgi:biopolymer transport protein ExbD
MALRRLGAAPDLAPTPSSGGVTGINVTPLVDVLLVLIVVGLVSFGVSRRTLPVSLPPTTVADGLVAPIVLELPGSGGYRLNGQVIPAGQLADQLTSVFRSRPAKILFIKTGAARSYQEFITAADIARGAGVVTIAVVGGGR